MSNKLQQMLLARREAEARAKAASLAPTPTAVAVAKAVAPTPEVIAPTDVAGHALGKGAITFDMLNAEQRMAVKLFQAPFTAISTGDFVLDGPAGTGKTTTVKLGIQAALDSGLIRNFPSGFDEDSPMTGPEKNYFEDPNRPLKRLAPRIAIVSYTNVAVRNIKEVVANSIKSHTTTIHKLLGYAPEDIEVEVMEKGLPVTKVTQRFTPTFGREPTSDGGSGLGQGLKLPHLDLLVIEEAGTVPVWLFKTLYSALPNPERTRFVFLGDIEQLDPAFGDGILGFKQLELPCVSLTEVYRNVGLVTKLAHRILKGTPIGPKEALDWNQADESGSIQMKPFKMALSWEKITPMFGKQVLGAAIASGTFHETTDIVLIPFNKQFGTIELNKYIMQAIVERDQLQVQEIIAGRDHHYIFVGMRVMLDKQFYKVTSIEDNPDYTGTTKPFHASYFIDMWGRRRPARRNDPLDLERYEQESDMIDAASTAQAQAAMNAADVDALLSQMGSDGKPQESNSASHIVHLEAIHSDGTLVGEEDAVGVLLKRTAKSSSAINSFLYPYALTVYKAQGSEYQRVHLVLHQSHGIALKRELFYTGVTRARRDLILYYSDISTTKSTQHDTLTKAIVNQAIPGRNRAEKLDHFRRKQRQALQKAALFGIGKNSGDLDAIAISHEDALENCLKGNSAILDDIAF